MTAAATAVFCAAAPQIAPGQQPSPAPDASGLPEIGRTKAVRLPCVVIRDLVAPSIGAAMDASAAFEAAKGDLHAFGLVPGGRRLNDGGSTMILMALDRKKSAIAKDVLAISKALGDSRVAPNQTDPAAKELRDALQQLYDAENAKLNALSGFIEAQRWSQLFNEDEGITAMAKANAASNGAGSGRGPDTSRRPDGPRALATPASFALPTTKPASEVLLEAGNPGAGPTVAPRSPEKEVASATDAGAIAQSEARAAKTIVKIAQTCR
ncbi:MAG TPA: hypothetical protein VGC96_11795 [Candidatus Elarobacter sp.]